MASPTPKKQQPSRPSPFAQQAPLVSGRWLLWSLAAIFGGGLGLVYLTLCLLFWQGQWQILFHPKHRAQQAAATPELPLEDVRFATTEAGQPRLDGWFIPAGASARYQNQTILYLHAMTTGSLADAVPELTAVHQLGINIFAFDYRGFGKSEAARPSEQLATEDTDAAWDYLLSTRHIPAASILLYGTGLGASLAAEAAERHPEAAGLIVDDATQTAFEILNQDSRSRLIPVRFLMHDRFDPAAALKDLKQPKLFLLSPSSQSKVAQEAADPKLIVYLPGRNDEPARREALQRFLDDLSQR